MFPGEQENGLTSQSILWTFIVPDMRLIIIMTMLKRKYYCYIIQLDEV